MTENKTALILEGGAMRGLYSAGVLDVLMKNNINADVVYGVSAGALFGLNYKSRQIGRAIRYNLKYIKEKDYMGLYSLLTTGNIVNKDFCFRKLVYELDKVDFETYKNNPVAFYVVVTNLQTGKPEYIKIDDVQKDLDMEYLRASGSMPFVSKPVEIKGNLYLDGAIGDAVPFKKGLANYERIIVVLTRPQGYRQKKTHLPYKLFYGKFPKFVETAYNNYKKYNETMDLIEKYESENKIVVLRPSKLVRVRRIEKNKNKLKKIYNLGISDCINKLDKIKEYVSVKTKV